MSIENSDVTIVMQGGLAVGWDVAYSAAHLRTVMPGARIVLATQKAAAKGYERTDAFDEVVLTDDPGALPPVKLIGAPHNINRQILSSRAGLAVVTTPYAMKLRTDAYLLSRKAVDLWSRWGEGGRGDRAKGKGRILVINLFTLNPGFDERLPWHVSDMFQFGRTEDLRAFWNAPPMDFGTNVHYETHPFAEGSLPREREFRSRFATEQWLTLGWLYGEPSRFPIRFHNDVSLAMVRQFEADLTDNFVVAHPTDIDLEMPKHRYVYGSRYFNTICYSFEDWKRLAFERCGLTGDDVGWTRWPRTERDKRLFVEARQRLRFLGRFGWARRLHEIIG
ncbi:WavE lipopolysaccharide synthesis family protein [Aureimonas leprariae]|uniref:WavE lipopolysaccharide synthesis n=1 Tax=Plantimonas leprariae TaxID=2615207 RepID=A0A7V7TXS0_9HYPH|nr:WavE lipopolysaccharide synthesis family protein [Aureimonas leprariae]KAB0676011.1 hypothetical protein F6X38_22375 [Aureimonas leprariae]